MVRGISFGNHKERKGTQRWRTLLQYNKDDEKNTKGMQPAV